MRARISVAGAGWSSRRRNSASCRTEATLASRARCARTEGLTKVQTTRTWAASCESNATGFFRKQRDTTGRSTPKTRGLRACGMAMLSMMMLRRKIGPTQTRKVEVYCQKLSEPKNSKSSYQIAFITRTFNSSVLTFVSFNNPFVNSIRLVHNSWRSKKVISLVCSRTACIISIIALINKREREAQWISGTESPYILRLTFRSL